MILGPPRGIPDPPGGVGGFWGVYKSWLEHFLGLNYCTPKNISKSSKAGTEGPVQLHVAHMSLCPGFSYYPVAVQWCLYSVFRGSVDVL